MQPTINVVAQVHRKRTSGIHDRGPRVGALGSSSGGGFGTGGLLEITRDSNAFLMSPVSVMKISPDGRRGGFGVCGWSDIDKARKWQLAMRLSF
jgi:hypothetical protein